MWARKQTLSLQCKRAGARIIVRQSSPREDVGLRCVGCGNTIDEPLAYRCSACGGVVEVAISLGPDEWETDQPGPGACSMWRYRRRLPIASEEIVSLGEGATPLLPSPSALGGTAFEGTVLLKDETGNPTGSFKDRLVSVAVSRALADGYTGIVCASTGNAGASAAAYAARAGVPCVVCVPASAPAAKLEQIQSYGPVFVAVDGNYSDAWRLADELQARGRYANVTTTYQNPYGVAALRTVSYELIDELDGQVPDAIFVPTGSGPLVRGVLWGYEEALALGIVDRLPALVAVQAAGCAPIVRAFTEGATTVRPWDEPLTVAAGIADPLQGYAEDGTYTLSMVRKSGGWAVAVTDAEMQDAATDLATRVGIFAETSGSAGLAGLRASVRQGLIGTSATAVVLVTGSGFKDLDIRLPLVTRRMEFDPRVDDVAALCRAIESVTEGRR